MNCHLGWIDECEVHESGMCTDVCVCVCERVLVSEVKELQWMVNKRMQNMLPFENVIFGFLGLFLFFRSIL